MNPHGRDGVAVSLFLAALLVSAGRLSVTGWTDGLELVVLMALAGGLIGLLLGISRFRSWVMAACVAVYTIGLLPWVFGLHYYPALAWSERLGALAWRWQTSLATLAAHQPLEDTFLFLVLVSLGYWCVGLIGGLALTRRAGFALTIGPAGLAFLIVHTFDSHRPGGGAYLFLYLLAALSLLARLHFLARRAEWQQARVYAPQESLHDWNLAVAVMVLVTLTLAWLVPAPHRAVGFARRTWQTLTRGWENQETDFSRLVAGLQVGERTVPYAGERLVLEQDAVQASDVVFTVRLPPVDTVPRYYWRVGVYDFYTDGRWETRQVISRQFSPAEAPFSLAEDQGDLATYGFTLQVPSDWLFTPLRPRWVSLPARVGLIAGLPESSEPLFFQVVLQSGQEYQVQALEFSPGEAQLRAAGQDYPAWVRERYLQLPPDFPPRLRALAADLTANAPTPYDKAQAITDWLRTSIRYTAHLPPPPAGRDVLEWFLFDIRQGFCTYYASAQVVLLRAVGVPARLATGYAEGEIPPGTLRLRQVRQSHAHAWPEVYFPGLGWVEFEPTTAQSPLRRPPGEVPAGDRTPSPQLTTTPPTTTPSSEGAPPANAVGGKPAWTRGRIVVGILLVGALAVFLTAYLLWKRRGWPFASPLPLRLCAWWIQRGQRPPHWLLLWARRSAQTPIRRAYVELYRAARRLGIELSPAQTPLEVASAVRDRLPEAALHIEGLLEACLPAIYGPQPGDWRSAHQAAVALRRLSRRAAWRKRLHMG